MDLLGGSYRLTLTAEGAEEPTIVRGNHLILIRITPEGWKLFRHAAT